MIPVSYSICLCISELGATAETCAIGTCAIHGRACAIGLFTPQNRIESTSISQ